MVWFGCCTPCGGIGDGDGGSGDPPFGPCTNPCSPGETPAQYQVDLFNFDEYPFGNRDCEICDSLNGTYILDQVQPCQWVYNFIDHPCTFQFIALDFFTWWPPPFYNATTYIRVTVKADPWQGFGTGTVVFWKFLSEPIDCASFNNTAMDTLYYDGFNRPGYPDPTWRCVPPAGDMLSSCYVTAL